MTATHHVQHWEDTIPLQRGQDISMRYSSWVDLPQLVGNGFDLAMMRGNSLIYANSWTQDKGNFAWHQAEQAVKASLGGVYKVLKQEGIFYVDITHKDEEEDVKEWTRKEEGKVTSLKLDIEYIRESSSSKHRIVRSTLTRDGEEDRRMYNSYLLPHERLEEMLRETGFSEVERDVHINGENQYTVFLARK